MPGDGQFVGEGAPIAFPKTESCPNPGKGSLSCTQVHPLLLIGEALRDRSPPPTTSL